MCSLPIDHPHIHTPTPMALLRRRRGDGLRGRGLGQATAPGEQCQGSGAPCLWHLAPAHDAVLQILIGEIEHQGLTPRIQTLPCHRLHRCGAQGQRQGQVGLRTIELLGLGAQNGQNRRAIADLADQARLVQHPHGVRGRGMGGKGVGAAQSGTRHIDQAEQLIGAVLIEKEVIDPHMLQFPGVAQELIALPIAELEHILPDIAGLDIRVFDHLVIVGGASKKAGIAPQQPLPQIDKAVLVLRHLRAITDGVGQQAGTLILPLAIDAQEGMAKHGGGAVDIGGGEDEAYPGGTQLAEPLLIGRAIDAWGLLRPTRQYRLQPVETGGKAALGMDIALGLGLCERFKGCLQLRFGLDGTRGGQKEARIIDLAAPFTLGPLVVEQRAPGL